MINVLLTILVIYVIWFAFRHQKRIKAAYDEVQEKKKAQGQPPPEARVPVAQDMTPCPKCGAYVVAGEPHTCDAASAP